jgi:hypothetical protein
MKTKHDGYLEDTPKIGKPIARQKVQMMNTDY